MKRITNDNSVNYFIERESTKDKNCENQNAIGNANDFETTFPYQTIFFELPCNDLRLSEKMFLKESVSI